MTLRAELMAHGGTDLLKRIDAIAAALLAQTRRKVSGEVLDGPGLIPAPRVANGQAPTAQHTRCPLGSHRVRCEVSQCAFECVSFNAAVEPMDRTLTPQGGQTLFGDKGAEAQKIRASK